MMVKGIGVDKEDGLPCLSLLLGIRRRPRGRLRHRCFSYIVSGA